jgi:hypothetical protein
MTTGSHETKKLGKIKEDRETMQNKEGTGRGLARSQPERESTEPLRV